MAEFFTPFRVKCTCCELLECYQSKDSVDGRIIVTAEGEIIEYSEPVVDCLVLHDLENENYMLWVLGLSWMMGPECFQSGVKIF